MEVEISIKKQGNLLVAVIEREGKKHSAVAQVDEASREHVQRVVDGVLDWYFSQQ